MHTFLILSSAANKEAAYVNTLRFAVIAHTVAKACRELGNEGLLHSCTCDGPTVQTGGDTISCSDDVDFGLQFADKFLRLGIGSTNSREFLDLHNFRVGELVSTINYFQTFKEYMLRYVKWKTLLYMTR